MNSTKALTQLGFVTARGLDNGEVGALLLSNQVGFVHRESWILRRLESAVFKPGRVLPIIWRYTGKVGVCCSQTR